MRVVDDHRWRAVHVERDVADDADDLELPSAGGDALAGNAFVRHAGKCDAGEVGAHDGPIRRARGITIVEAASGQHGNPEGGKQIAADDPLLHREAASIDRRAGQRSAANLRVPRVIAASRWKTGDAACGRHARDRLEPAGQLLLEGRSPRLVVPNRRQIQLEGEHTLDANADVHLLQPMEAGQKHGRACQQRQRERQL